MVTCSSWLQVALGMSIGPLASFAGFPPTDILASQGVSIKFNFGDGQCRPELSL